MVKSIFDQHSTSFVEEIKFCFLIYSMSFTGRKGKLKEKVRYCDTVEYQITLTFVWMPWSKYNSFSKAEKIYKYINLKN